MSQTRVDDMERLNQWIGAAIKRGAIAVLTHRNGDMDTVGSACALANIIGHLWKPVNAGVERATHNK